MQLDLYFASSIQSLVELGGIPVAAILCLGALIFVLFFERMYFLGISFKRALPSLSQQQDTYKTLSIWERQRIHDSIISEALSATQRSFWLLKAAIVSCPLVGLMGTVSGMIFVFDQISLTGTGNPRVMASGIFKATLPTMAGMMISIVGLIMQYILKRLYLHSQATLSASLASHYEQAQRQPLR